MLLRSVGTVGCGAITSTGNSSMEKLTVDSIVLDGTSITDGTATLNQGSLVLNDISCNGDISCNDISCNIISGNGINLRYQTTVMTNTLSNGFGSATVTTTGHAGRIQITPLSSLGVGQQGAIYWINPKLQSDSIVLLTLDASRNQMGAWDMCTVAMFKNINTASPSTNYAIVISNNAQLHWASNQPLNSFYYINYLIINPTS